MITPSKIGIRIATAATLIASIITSLVASPAYAVTELQIGNGTQLGNGTYLNAQNIADNLVFTSILAQATTSVSVVDPIDLSTSQFGAPHFSLTLQAPVCDINNSINMAAAGNLIFNCGTVNFNAQITSGGTTIDPSRVIGAVLPTTDTTAPILPTLSDINVSATSVAGTVVNYGPSTATDAVDGTDPVVFTPASGATFALGTHAVSYIATDAAGNSATPKSFNVTVTVPWGGVLQPVNADGSSSFKLGSTIPVKFAGFAGLDATLTATKSDSVPDGTDAEAVSSNPADSGDLFRYDATSGQYIFNLGTKSLSVGDWYLHITTGDGVDHAVKFSLRK